MKPADHYRPPTTWETSVIDQLLREPFPGRDQLIAQSKEIEVSDLDNEGSVAIKVLSMAPAAPVEWRVPVEGMFRFEGGDFVSVLLHVVGGRMSELEFEGYSTEALTRARITDSKFMEVFVKPVSSGQFET